MTRIDNNGKVAFDIKLTNEATDASELYLTSTETGTVLASWTTRGTVADPDTEDPVSELNIARIDKNGKNFWKQNCCISMPGVGGSNRMENIHHHEDLMSIGYKTYVFF